MNVKNSVQKSNIYAVPVHTRGGSSHGMAQLGSKWVSKTGSACLLILWL